MATFNTIMGQMTEMSQ